jgi:hypothetical protein
MTTPILVLIGDFGLGTVQRRVLHWAIRQHCHQPLTLAWATDLALSMPAGWSVKPEVGLPLAAKLWLIDHPSPAPRLFLDGNVILQGDVAELLLNLPPVGIGVPQPLPLKSLQVFAMAGGQGPNSAPVIPRRRHDYALVADFAAYPHHRCPDSWQPVPYGCDPRANIIDCTALPQRPWYRPSAASGGVWLAQLQQAVQAGALAWSQIKAEVTAQQLHPDWLGRLAGSEGEAAICPGEEPMAPFIPPEIRVSAAQRQQLMANHYPLPQKSLRKVLVSPYLWEVVLPHRLDRLLGRGKPDST